MKFACTTLGFCRFFESYELAWKFAETYFNNTGRVLCVEAIN